MAQSFTESLFKNRMIVVAVDRASKHVRVKEASEVCTDLTCGETLVVSDEGSSSDLGTLNPGDIVKLEGQTGRPQRIVVVRRVWDELTSPEW
jgi:hypothetical protein